MTARKFALKLIREKGRFRAMAIAIEIIKRLPMKRRRRVKPTITVAEWMAQALDNPTPPPPAPPARPRRVQVRGADGRFIK